MNSPRVADISPPGAGAVLAVMITLSLAVLLAAAAHPFSALAEPWLPAVMIYYWTLRRPDLTPPVLSFIAGLALDLLSGGPLGLWALSLTGLTLGARLARPWAEGASLVRRTALFALALSAMILAALVALSASGIQGEVPFAPMLIHAAFTLAVYPLLEPLMNFIARRAGLGKGVTL